MAHGRDAPADHDGRAGGSVWQAAAPQNSPVPLPRSFSRTMRRARVVAAGLYFAAAAACAPLPPDLVLLNARVFTADPIQPWAEAVAIRGDRITAVGSTSTIAALAGPRTVRRDLGGRTVLPGLNDAHVVDPGLRGPELRGFLQAAVMSGITSMQWFVGDRTAGEAGAELVRADSPVRIRVLRMPRPGADGSTIDSRPHLPPQPSARVDIRGMGFAFGDADTERLRQAVGWAYGTEDLLAVEPHSDDVLDRYVEAVEQTGVTEVWIIKRPRIERAGAAGVRLAARLKRLGMVVVQRPDGPLPLASLARGGVHLALGTGRGAQPFAALGWAASGGAEALTMEQAVIAFTRGSAYAEHGDEDKGHLSIGALADLAVVSVDPFSASSDRLDGARSILTIIGGRVVHDVP